VEGGLLLNVVVRKSAAVLELLAGEDETLLVGGNALLVLDLGLDIVDGVGRLDLKGNGLAGEGLDENLHTTAETEDEVKGGLLLDVVVREGAAVLELLAGENETLLVGRNALLVLNLGLDVVDGVRGLDLKGNGLASKGLDEDLHTTTEAKNEVEGGLLLNVVIGKGAAVLKLLAGEDQALLVGGDALLVLNLGLDVVDGVRGLDLKGNGLASKGLDENLHGLIEKERVRCWSQKRKNKGRRREKNERKTSEKNKKKKFPIYTFWQWLRHSKQRKFFSALVPRSLIGQFFA